MLLPCEPGNGGRLMPGPKSPTTILPRTARQSGDGPGDRGIRYGPHGPARVDSRRRPAGVSNASLGIPRLNFGGGGTWGSSS